MPAGYHISEDEGLISVQVSDRIDLVELYESAKALHSDPSYSHELPLLVDLRNMRLTISQPATAPFSRFIITRFNGRAGSNAVVIDPDLENELFTGIHWLACAVSGTELFDDYDQALKWLIRREFAEPKVSVCQAAR